MIETTTSEGLFINSVISILKSYNVNYIIDPEKLEISIKCDDKVLESKIANEIQAIADFYNIDSE